jgi:hypothetical protein
MYALSHTRRKCLVPHAFTHSLRSLAHLNRADDVSYLARAERPVVRP